MTDPDARESVGVGGIAVASVIALLVGVFCGVVTTFVHRQWGLQLGPVVIPWGLLAGLALVAALLLGFRIVFDSRVVAAAAAVGVLVATGVLALPGAGGSVLVVDEPVGWVWAFGPAVVAVAVVGWPRGRASRTT